MAVTPAALEDTRRALHGVAELVLAGPQYRRSGTIRLTAVPGGFGMIKEPSVRVTHASLVWGHGSAPIDGQTCAELAEAAGLDVGAPQGLYQGGSGVSAGAVLTIDGAAATFIAETLELGERALRLFAPDQTPVLWPEHFDLSISVDEVNYGVSAGDSYLGEPYAYVGPWKPLDGDFWDAPFGATRSMRDVFDLEGLRAFFVEGRAHATR